MKFHGFHDYGMKIPKHKTKAKKLLLQDKERGLILDEGVSSTLGYVLSYHKAHNDEAAAFYLVMLAERLNQLLKEEESPTFSSKLKKRKT